MCNDGMPYKSSSETTGVCYRCSRRGFLRYAEGCVWGASDPASQRGKRQEDNDGRLHRFEGNSCQPAHRRFGAHSHAANGFRRLLSPNCALPHRVWHCEETKPRATQAVTSLFLPSQRSVTSAWAAFPFGISSSFLFAWSPALFSPPPQSVALMHLQS